MFKSSCKGENTMELRVYYLTYLWSCLALIFGLAWVLRRSGGVLLRDAFGANTAIVHAIGRLMDVGYYLVSFGYVALTFETYQRMDDMQQVFEIVIRKLGWLLLVLGVVHLFNMLLLAGFRKPHGKLSPGQGADGSYAANHS
jgi:hypothetical protein